MTTHEHLITELHDLWCSTTNQELHKKATERLFYEFISAGFNSDDLTCVLKYMQGSNRKGGGRYKIQCHKILGDHEVFASILAEAKAIERNRRKAATASEKIMQQYEKVVDPEQSSVLKLNGGRHLSDVIKTLGNQ